MSRLFSADLINTFNQGHIIYTERVVGNNLMAQTVQLELLNISHEVLTLKPLGKKPDRKHHHIKILFRNKVLSDYAVKHLKLKDGSDFEMSKVESGTFSGTHEVFLTAKKEIEVEVSKVLLIEFEHFQAINTKSDHTTNISIDLKDIELGDQKKHDRIKTPITITNSLINRKLPVEFIFRDHNTVLNTGGYNNDLYLQILNTEIPQEEKLGSNTDIIFNTSSSVTVGFDVQQGNQTKEYALCTKGEGEACSVSFPSGWTNTSAKVLDGHGRLNWTFAPSSSTQKIGSLQKMTFSIEKLKSSTPAGVTHIYLTFNNIPSFGNASFVIPVIKTPLVTRKEQVGIGKTPNVTLDVAGKGDGTIELQVNGRISSTGNAGGLWVDGSGNKFVGAADTDSIGFFNTGWHFTVNKDASATAAGKLTVNKDATIKGALQGNGTLTIGGATTLNGELKASQISVNKTLLVNGKSSLNGTVDFNAGINVKHRAYLKGGLTVKTENTELEGKLMVGNDTTLRGGLSVSKEAKFLDKLVAKKSFDLGGKFTINGKPVFVFSQVSPANGGEAKTTISSAYTAFIGGYTATGYDLNEHHRQNWQMFAFEKRGFWWVKLNQAWDGDKTGAWTINVFGIHKSLM